MQRFFNAACQRVCMKPKQILLALPLLCLAATTCAQQTTYSAGVNSGLFSISSKNSSISSTVVLRPLMRFEVMGPSKSSAEFSYEINGRMQRNTRNGLIYGAELAFQSLRSSVDITYAIPFSYSSALLPANGKVKMHNSFIALTPYAGFRILDKKITVDLTSGLEIAACIKRDEQITVQTTYTNDRTEAISELKKTTDYRVRFQVITSFKKIGITAGYAAGLKNYYHKDDLLTGHSRFIRLGLTYRIH